MNLIDVSILIKKIGIGIIIFIIPLVILAGGLTTIKYIFTH